MVVGLVDRIFFSFPAASTSIEVKRRSKRQGIILMVDLLSASPAFVHRCWTFQFLGET